MQTMVSRLRPLSPSPRLLLSRSPRLLLSRPSRLLLSRPSRLLLSRPSRLLLAVALVATTLVGCDRCVTSISPPSTPDRESAPESESSHFIESESALESDSTRAAAASDSTGSDPARSQSATAILAIDTHADTTQRLADEGSDLTQRLDDGQLDFPRMREGGLSAVFMSIWVDPRLYPGERAWERTEVLMRSVRSFADANPEECVIATTAREVREAHDANKIALLIGVEGAHALGQAAPAVLFARLESLHRAGARYLTLTWTGDNVFAHASTGGHPDRGLTRQGRELIRRLNQLGVIADVSHTSDRTALEVAALSDKPVFASHSSARAIAEHPRNVPDEVARAVAESGGGICVNYYAQFVDPDYGARRRALEQAHQAEFDAIEGRSWASTPAKNALARQLDPSLVPPSLEVLVRHFTYLSELIGPEHVCLGSDYDGVSELAGMEDVSELPELFAALGAQGLPVRAIAGENVLRILAANVGE